MATLHSPPTELRAPLAEQREIAEWLAAWPEVRRQFEQLIAQYIQEAPEYDRQMSAWVLDDLDRLLPEFEYRTAWLQQRLEQSEIAR